MEFDYKMGMEYYQDIFQREVKLTNEQMRQCMLSYAEMYKIRGEVSSINSLVESLETQLKEAETQNKKQSDDIKKVLDLISVRAQAGIDRSWIVGEIENLIVKIK